NACIYTYQAALGLQHAFEHNMVHRDIKPQNLIVAKEGKKQTVKILDFGIAKVKREAQTSAMTDLTSAGQMLGTPDYIAPEQLQNATQADIRSDIYSLGCTLYFLLTGRPPFKGENMFAVLQAHLTKEAPAVNKLRPEVPPVLAAVVTKMIAKDPAKRYQM